MGPRTAFVTSALALLLGVPPLPAGGVAPQPGPEGPQAARADAPAHRAVAGRFTVEMFWRSERSGDMHVRHVAAALGALEEVLAEGRVAAGEPPRALTVALYATPRELEQAAAARGATANGRGAAVRADAGLVLLALRPRVVDRVHHVLGTSPFLVRRAVHEVARLVSAERSDLAAPAEPAYAARARALALAEAALRRAGLAAAPADEVALSHGRVALGRALAAGTEPLALLGAPPAPEAGHGEAYDAGDAARLAVGEVWLATGAWPAPEALPALLAAAAADARYEEVGPGSAWSPPRRAPGPDGVEVLVDPGGIEQWATRQVDALALLTEPIAVRRYVIGGTFEPHALDGETPAQADIAFADHGGGDRCLCVFSTREGTWVFKRDPATGEYAPITGDANLRPVGGGLNVFELRVEDDLIVVALNGQVLKPGRAAGLDLSGRYGPGAHVGTGVIWRGLTWSPLEE